MDPRILYSFQSAVLFFILASPYMYAATAKLIKLNTYNRVALHAVVYGLIVYGLMLIQG